MKELKEYIEDVCGGFAKLNSITKYPSIPVYHEMGDRGRLTEKRVDMGEGPWTVTEKVDGTNARIILTPKGWVIGSREELLCAQGDLVGNPALGIVQALRDYADKLDDEFTFPDRIRVFYQEVYGGRTSQAARCYTADKDVFGAMVFDVAELFEGKVQSLAAMDRSSISLLRDRDRDRFRVMEAEVGTREWMSLPLGLNSIHPVQVDRLPGDFDDTWNWMLEQVRAIGAVDSFAIKKDQIEGFVVRSADGSRISKLRFQDYRRTRKALEKAA